MKQRLTILIVISTQIKVKTISLRLSDTTYNAPKVSCISEVLGKNQMGLFVEVTRSATVAEARLQLTHQPRILE